MNGKSLFALNLGWLALVVAAFIAGTTIRNEEPAPEKLGKAADPARITTQAGSPRPAEVTGSGPESTSPTANVVASVRAGDPNGQGRRVANTLRAIEDAKASHQAQLEQYGEDLAALLDEVTVESAPAVAEALTQSYSGIGENEPVGDLWLEFFGTWGALAGPDAMAFIRNNNTYEAYVAVAEAWAMADPAAAKAYVINAPNDGVGGKVGLGQLHRGVVRGLVKKDLNDAIAYSAIQEARSGDRTYSVIHLAEKVFEQRGADGIESWLASVEEIHGEGEARDYKTELVKFGLSRLLRGEENLDRAREWLAANVRKGLVDAEAIAWGSNRLAAGPEDRLAWLMMPDPADLVQQNDYSQLVSKAFGDYLRSDFDAAGAWLASQPADRRNDGAVQQFALEAARYDREAALLWANEIGNERLRAATLAKLTGQAPIVRPD